MLSSIDAYETLKEVSTSEFGSYFPNFRRQAFRLELLSSYREETEAPFLNRYHRGASCPEDFNLEWLGFIDDSVRSNKTVSRARYVALPLNLYTEFEIAWGYRRSARHGERIHLFGNDVLEQCSECVPILNDFWLFDATHCFLMFYDATGRFLGVHETPSSLTPAYVELAESLMNWASPLEQTNYLP